MVWSKYEGTASHILGVIQVELLVGTITKPTLFMVIASNVNYNMLLGRGWIMVLVQLSQLFTKEFPYGAPMT